MVNHLNDPVFVQILRTSSLVLTESREIQEEAPAFGAPTLVLSETTERPAEVNTGIARLFDTSPHAIIEASTPVLSSDFQSGRGHVHNAYGDGQASRRIVVSLRSIKCDDFVPQRTYDNKNV